MARRPVLALTTLAALIAFSSGSLASMPDTEFKTLLEQYDAKMKELRSEGRTPIEDAVALQSEFSAKFPMSDLTIAQLGELHRRGLITTYKPGSEGDRSKEALAALDLVSKSPTVDAVEALALKATILSRMEDSPEKIPAMTDAISRALSHREFPEALRENRAGSIWYVIGYEMPLEALPELADEIDLAARRFPVDADVMSCAGVTNTYERAFATDDAKTRSAANELRVKAMAALERAMAVEGGDERTKAMAKREHSSLDAAPRIASLVGNPAPELDFTWSSGETIRNLADLKGKVVVLDFWATWCGPCIGSFPQVRELAAHYQGYPVEIIGVTSVQGATYFQSGVEKAETPAIEHEQMKRFIKERDITWTVAFTEQEVFNPEYGIRGIPHVVIIDPDGKIVHRALHPASSLAKKTALIDPILEQFGFETPPAPKDDENTKGGE